LTRINPCGLRSGKVSASTTDLSYAKWQIQPMFFYPELIKEAAQESSFFFSQQRTAAS
jgi:hypothetical protein